MFKIFNSLLIAFNFGTFGHLLLWVLVAVMCLTLYFAYSKIVELEVVRPFKRDVKFTFIKQIADIFAKAFKVVRNSTGLRVVAIALALISIVEFSLGCFNAYKEKQGAEASA